MALAPVVDSLDSIPDAVKGAYVEKDGKFHLDFDIPDVAGLKKALDAERGMNKSVKDKIAAWEKLGKGPEEIESMLEAERVKAEDALKKAGKFDEVLNKKLGDQKKEFDTALSTANKQRESALNVARTAVRNTELATALTKAKATAEGMVALPKLLGDRIQIEFDDNGQATATIKDADGTPMIGSGQGGKASFDDLVKEAIKQFPSLFEGTGGGSGKDPASRRDAGSKVLTRTEFNALSPAEQRQKVTVEKYKIVDG